MSDFMPVERVEFADFGPLTAVDITEGSVIVLELRNWQLSADDTALLRDRCQAIFPANPVMVVDPKKLGVKVMDQPQDTGRAEAEAARDRVRAFWAALSAVTVVVQIVRGLRARRRR